MKKTLLALAVIAAAGTAQAAEVYKSDDVSVDFYGQLRQQVVFTDAKNANGDRVDPKIDAGSSRYGVNVAYNAADEGLTVLGNVELAAKNGDTRTHYIGMATEYGQFTYGQQAPLYDDVAYGAIYAYAFDNAPYQGNLGTDDNFFQTSSIKYALDVDNSWLAAQYNLSENDSNAELFEVFGGTNVDQFSFVLGGATQKDKTANQNIDTTYFVATVEYALENGVIGLTYANNKDKNKVSDQTAKSNGYHLGAKFGVAPKTSLYGGVQLIDGNTNVNDETNIYLGAEYMFAKWARTYVEYNFNDTDNQKDENNLAIGARVYW